MNIARRPIPLLRNQQVHRQRVLLLARAAFFLFPAGFIEQTHHVGVLFNGAGLAQIRELGLRLLSFSSSRFNWLKTMTER